MENKKTKVICTIGPITQDKELLREMTLAGMNAARLNFSHGAHQGHKEKMDLVKEVRDELGVHVAIILDTKGPEIRTGMIENDGVELETGQKFVIYTDESLGNKEGCCTSYKEITNDVRPGNKILIDDGLLELTVDEVLNDRIVCTVDNGGLLKNQKSMNLPGVSVKLPAMSEKDADDIQFGIKEGVDFVAASFIRRASDVIAIRKFLDASGGKQIKIISKIENREGVDNIDEIMRVSDGIMVARGDLGVEIPPEDVPLIQKEIIRKCNRAGIFVITATQMMDSMTRNPRPTRAEVADVANAVLDGTDVIMLSGETASGKYPLESVKMMVHVAMTVEKAVHHHRFSENRAGVIDSDVTNVIGFAACNSADLLKAKAIVVPTSSGQTAMIVSKYRPKTPIISFTMHDTVARQLSLIWGVTAHIIAHMDDQQEFFRTAIHRCTELIGLKEGDVVALTTGVPFGAGGSTNMCRIHHVGQAF